MGCFEKSAFAEGRGSFSLPLFSRSSWNAQSEPSPPKSISQAPGRALETACHQVNGVHEPKEDDLRKPTHDNLEPRRQKIVQQVEGVEKFADKA